jgi:L-lactate dehydrogenase complex protein LldG
MTERESIFARIREALSVEAPKPGGRHGDAVLTATRHAGAVLPPVGGTFDEHLALFAKNAAELRADFNLLANAAEVTAALKQLATAEGWERVATHTGELTDPAVSALSLPALRTDAAYDKHELERCDAGISECDCLVAQTGTLIVTTRSAGGRALSVLPPHHVVLARREQLLPDLPAAFALLKSKYGAAYPSMMSLITGPSRTGDIERILVLGAHGPKKLTILCW